MLYTYLKWWVTCTHNVLGIYNLYSFVNRNLMLNFFCWEIHIHTALVGIAHLSKEKNVLNDHLLYISSLKLIFSSIVGKDKCFL